MSDWTKVYIMAPTWAARAIVGGRYTAEGQDTPIPFFVAPPRDANQIISSQWAHHLALRFGSQALVELEVPRSGLIIDDSDSDDSDSDDIRGSVDICGWVEPAAVVQGRNARIIRVFTGEAA